METPKKLKTLHERQHVTHLRLSVGIEVRKTPPYVQRPNLTATEHDRNTKASLMNNEQTALPNVHQQVAPL